MTMELATFSLVDAADVDAFVAADADLQRDMMINDRGFVRRTTARGDGGWAVVTLWASREEAEASVQRTATSDAGRAFAAFVEPSSVRREIFEELGG